MTITFGWILMAIIVSITCFVTTVMTVDMGQLGASIGGRFQIGQWTALMLLKLAVHVAAAVLVAARHSATWTRARTASSQAQSGAHIVQAAV